MFDTNISDSNPKTPNPVNTEYMPRAGFLRLVQQGVCGKSHMFGAGFLVLVQQVVCVKSHTTAGVLQTLRRFRAPKMRS